MNSFYYEKVKLKFPKGLRVHALSDSGSKGTVELVQRNPVRYEIGEVQVKWDATGILSVTHPGYLVPLSDAYETIK